MLLEVNGARRAVPRDVSLTLRPGEAVGLVGESGSGKSMTARAIGRLLPPGAEVHGSIRFGGTEIGQLAGADLRRYRGQMAMIFQDPRAHINPVRRIGGFMTEALRTNHEAPRAQARRRGGHARPGGHRGRDPATPAVPASDVRRDPAVGHNRRGPADRAPPAAGRRADHRPRRHHPGRGHGDTGRPGGDGCLATSSIRQERRPASFIASPGLGEGRLALDRRRLRRSGWRPPQAGRWCGAGAHIR